MVLVALVVLVVPVVLVTLPVVLVALPVVPVILLALPNFLIFLLCRKSFPDSWWPLCIIMIQKILKWQRITSSIRWSLSKKRVLLQQAFMWSCSAIAWTNWQPSTSIVTPIQHVNWAVRSSLKASRNSFSLQTQRSFRARWIFSSWTIKIRTIR